MAIIKNNNTSRPPKNLVLGKNGIVWSNVLERLRSQHGIDLKVYRSAHRERRNRTLHWLLIPVECWSALQFLWILTAVVVRAISVPVNNAEFAAIGWCRVIIGSVPRVATGLLGCLSLLIATNASTGIATFLFHLFLVRLCDGFVPMQIQMQMKMEPELPQNNDHRHRDLWEVSAIVGLSWTVAWIVQVGVGHALFEKNLPNIVNPSDNVSYLAMCQSVLIAWSS
mmetsp:Transcript_28656/g.61467  ORF Transcript_28656/g.61467 Transcript_28656/m.61467 type:complete len:225 (-) Transcript_28656:1309-1983(-)